MIYDVAIIGGGPAGYTAAMYAARAGLSVVVLEKLSAGGQMALTPQVDNYPGFPEGIDGFELADKMQQGAEKYGAVTELAEVKSVDLQAQPKKLDTSEGEFLARTVVFATGANPRLLGVPMERELTGKGVHYCAHCDGHFYKSKTVAIVGGGNSAVADALQLSRLAKKVYLIHRRDTLRATKIYHKSLENAENIEILWNNTVEKLLHGDRLTGIIIKNTKTGQEKDLKLDGLFVSVGREPVSWLAEDVGKDAGGYIIAGESTETNIPGVFAIGDVRTKAMRQIVTAMADGAVAAQMAEEYMAGL